MLWLVVNILSKKQHLKHEGLSGERVVSWTKYRKWFCSALFLKIHKAFKLIIRQIANCNLLKVLFVFNFYNKEMFSLLPAISNFFTIGWIFSSFYAYQQPYHQFDQYFKFFILIAFIDFFMSIFHIARVFNKSFRIIKIL